MGESCSVGQCETSHCQIRFICQEYSALVINDGRIYLAGIRAGPGNHGWRFFWSFWWKFLGHHHFTPNL